MKNNNIKDVINSLSPSESTKQEIKGNILAKRRQQNPKRGFSFKVKLAVSAAACVVIAVFALALINNQDIPPITSQDDIVTLESITEDKTEKNLFAGFVLTAYAAKEDEDMFLSSNYMEESQKQILKPNTKILLAQYSPAMSSVPGFPFIFDVKYECESNSDVMGIRLTTDGGELLNWDTNTWQITALTNPVEIQSGNTFYWSPLSDDGSTIENASITVEAISNGEAVARQIIYITQDEGDLYYYAQAGNVEFITE